jgi:riboflavin kinase / FMN adenylyltransferase
MHVIRLPEDPAPETPPPAVVTIGNFDGVHLGHRRLLARVRERAKDLGALAVMVTFDPHPRHVLQPDVPLEILTTTDEKAHLLAEQTFDQLIVWRFDSELQRLGPEEFVDALSRYVALRHLVHGPGFALGRRRAGTPEVLAEIGRRRGFTLEEVSPIQSAAGVPVNSTSIRRLLAEGDVSMAAEHLGRPPALVGVVVEGEKVGRTLGFPTANLDVGPRAAVPADGVYAAWAERSPFTAGATRHAAAVSIGTRPTFDGTRRVVEAYLLDFGGDLYGERLRLHFVARLRGQEKYESIDALVAQMRRDVAAAREALDLTPGPSPYRRGEPQGRTDGRESKDAPLVSRVLEGEPPLSVPERGRG